MSDAPNSPDETCPLPKPRRVESRPGGRARRLPSSPSSSAWSAMATASACAGLDQGASTRPTPADLLEHLPPDAFRKAIHLLDKDLPAEAVAELSDEMRAAALRELTDAGIA